MAYDEGLARGSGKLWAKRLASGGKKVFCGLCFMFGGNMLVGRPL